MYFIQMFTFPLFNSHAKCIRSDFREANFQHFSEEILVIFQVYTWPRSIMLVDFGLFSSIVNNLSL